MKRLIPILIAVLTVAALGAKLPIVEPYTYNGIPTAYDSVRRVVYNFNATTVLSNLVTADGDSIYREELTVDSCGTYKVNLTFYGNGQRIMVAKDIVSNCYGKGPVATASLTADAVWDEVIGGAHEASGSSGDLLIENNQWLTILQPGVQAIRDSMYEASQTGTPDLDSADLANISAQVVAGIGSESGTGINAVTLYARDTVNGAFVPDVYMTATSGAEFLNATTGPNGYATFNCNSATYTFNALGSPYTWVPFSRTIAGDITDTITGGGVTVTPPSSPELCRVYGWEISNSWDTLKGVNVSLEIVNYSDTMQAGGVSIGAKVATTRTNSNGYWQIDVVPNSILDPNSRYIYRVSGGGLIRAKSFEIEVPDTSQINIAVLPKRKVQ